MSWGWSDAGMRTMADHGESWLTMTCARAQTGAIVRNRKPTSAIVSEAKP